ncbi:MAG: transcriptional regulator TraR [Mesorhizobium sp.]|uniref:autoinducer-binding transcriptional regulator TraR n=1 Tax=Mesorhizobium sp. TaxID=1871066 RepID=UPI000FE54981|nr:transcriptional regulator TraR [Mesorhizobium sp.]RWH90146.1 MAG: transcriptional regulator TraR [Mesorhizobium sp.]RWK47775.1 MAG: transcriptional regulator TraR [Mesorhizobium sp.]RWK48831.1 MAG: transcriptional regulator TraR [Mesorhizobium sp.]RWK82611.1 MAG: transcriptional regulator TraR [Mesorhizobium sp.]RWL00887.1 MAG: transcriptional regulator TraR [Mesorhizobium sp.]
MQDWLDKLTDLTAIEGDQSNLEDALAGLAEQIGLGGYAYLNIQPGHMLAISNYHPEWQSIYFERNYSALDPVVRRAKTTKRTFTWSGELERSRLSKAERSFYGHAADFGIRSGITIPVKTANGSMSMFTLASEKMAVDLDREIDAVAAATAVAQLHARIAFLQATPSVERAAYLDPKEATYLRWIAVGKTMEEVADLEGVKYNSVRVKLTETKKRFDVHTTTHLTALAIRRKLI